MTLPTVHPQRIQLNDEVHARPPVPLITPARIAYLALLTEWAPDAEDLRPVAELASRFGVAQPEAGSNHFSADFGPFRMIWERHTEFTRYTFIVAADSETPFSTSAMEAVPTDWVESLPGQTLVVAHVALVNNPGEVPDHEHIAQSYFDGNVPVGAQLAGGKAMGYMDFRIHADGMSRVLVYDLGMTRRQAGRYVQRLLEIDTYRIMALLALPLTRTIGPALTKFESELVDITKAMSGEGFDDPEALLERLTRLAANIESLRSQSQYRFSAADAYHELVLRRIEELREQRIEGLQTFEEFTERRLAPAMNTCKHVARRQDALGERVAGATQLIATRLGVIRERQNQALLESMNRRAMLQLRLQQTVEGLSVAAITYYGVGLVSYAAKAINSGGVPINSALVTGVSVPIVAVGVALAVRRARKHFTERSGG